MNKTKAAIYLGRLFGLLALSALVGAWDESGDVEGHICGLIEGTDLGHGIKRGKLAGKRKAGK